jgi:glycosyltransferase involved in cell wall biosynthesis
VIDAFIALADKRPNWDLVMIGSGVLKDQLLGRVPDSLKGRVCFTGFIGEQSTITAIYKVCDVLVLPSDYEPWAVVINEAAAAGLAIVSSDVVGASAELVKDGVNGFLFPAGDLTAFTQRLVEVTSKERIEQFKAASAGVLSNWRCRADPVEGLQAALRHCESDRKVP